MAIDPQLLDPNTPSDVEIRLEAPEPIWDATLGIPLIPPHNPATHRLACLGDSITHGFQSFAIYNTNISYPAIIAFETGMSNFRFPEYNGYGGLPLNLELLVRILEEKYGATIRWWEMAGAAFTAVHHVEEVKDWWESGPGSATPPNRGILHNLAVYGWDVRDTLGWNATALRQDLINRSPDFIGDGANRRAALKVLSSAIDATGKALSPIQAARELGGEGDGIETLIVMLGANNALGSVVRLQVAWSEDAGYQDLIEKEKYTVWRPTHFLAEWSALVAELRNINAQHVIVATVPHVTIIPLARGVGTDKVRLNSRYFPYYTRPWISDEDFDPSIDPCITSQQARAIDSAIDQYNHAIIESVRQARLQGRDWYLFDLAGLLDRLACRRYIEDRDAQPAWWRGAYQLPPELQKLAPPVTSYFFRSDQTGRTGGGLFALDGVHPTTVAYGVIAQEIANIMAAAGVTFYARDGQTRRVTPVKVDFNRLLRLDSLISDPPKSITADLNLLGWFEERYDLIRKIF